MAKATSRTILTRGAEGGSEAAGSSYRASGGASGATGADRPCGWSTVGDRELSCVWGTVG